MARKYRHIGFADDVNAARSSGGTTHVLCGRRVHPLSPEAADAMPTCPTCAHRRDYRVSVEATSASTYRAVVWLMDQTGEAS